MQQTHHQQSQNIRMARVLYVVVFHIFFLLPGCSAEVHGEQKVEKLRCPDGSVIAQANCTFKVIHTQSEICWSHQFNWMKCNLAGRSSPDDRCEFGSSDFFTNETGSFVTATMKRRQDGTMGDRNWQCTLVYNCTEEGKTEIGGLEVVDLSASSTEAVTTFHTELCREQRQLTTTAAPDHPSSSTDDLHNNHEAPTALICDGGSSRGRVPLWSLFVAIGITIIITAIVTIICVAVWKRSITPEKKASSDLVEHPLNQEDHIV